MSKANFLISEPTKEKSEEAEERPLTSFLFIRQRSGLKAQRQRQKEERRWLKKVRHNQRGKSGRFNGNKCNKSQKASNQIQRGFDIAKRWKSE